MKRTATKRNDAEAAGWTALRR